MAFGKQLKFKGMTAVVKKMQKLDPKISVAATEAGETLANKILQRAKTLTPVESGDLQDSGHVEKGFTSVRGGTQEFYIEFSSWRGTEFDYAEIQHENTSYQHTVGTDHYLTKAMDYYKNKAMDEIARILYKKLF